MFAGRTVDIFELHFGPIAADHFPEIYQFAKLYHITIYFFKRTNKANIFRKPSLRIRFSEYPDQDKEIFVKYSLRKVVVERRGWSIHDSGTLHSASLMQLH